MNRHFFILPAAIAALSLFAGCGDDDAPNAATPPAASSPSVARPASEASQPQTRPAQTTAAASAVATRPASAPADGTVDAQNPGSTDPVTVKASPASFSGQAVLNDVRMGVHPEQGGWERIVFEFGGASLPPATVQYVQGASACGSGQPVSLPGSATLQVRLSQTAAHDQSGKVTVTSTSTKGPGNTILEAKQTCDSEGVVTWALGLKSKQNLKVTTLQNPTRLVIDIKQ
jgi:hypothetical protein